VGIGVLHQQPKVVGAFLAYLLESRAANLLDNLL
jgi:hypothetical protein